MGKIVHSKSPVRMTLLYNDKNYSVTAPLAHRQNIEPGHHVSFTAILVDDAFLYLRSFGHKEAK